MNDMPTKIDWFNLSKNTEQKIFREACNGFGFQEIEQHPDGLFCTGCLFIHKRPTKMYSNGTSGLGKCLCKFQVIRLFNPEDQ